jgi:hypothetical protein
MSFEPLQRGEQMTQPSQPPIVYKGKQASFFAPCYLILYCKSNICQDRLETNIGKTQTKRMVSPSRENIRRAAHERYGYGKRLLEEPILYRKRSIYQDRLGTNKGTLWNKGVFSADNLDFVQGDGFRAMQQRTALCGISADRVREAGQAPLCFPLTWTMQPHIAELSPGELGSLWPLTHT